MTDAHASSAILHVDELAQAIAATGREMALPYVAASADIGSPEPILDSAGNPFAGNLFRWIDPTLEYWKDRGFALRSPLVHATRALSEPFWFAWNSGFATWRPNAALAALTAEIAEGFATYHVAGAIVCPAYLPEGVIGAVTWATDDRSVDVKAVFDARAEHLHALALRFVATYREATHGAAGTPVRLTRREIQCLKWAAAGKTDAEISELVHIALPTVRFHVTNASRKLGVIGRSQAVHRAANLGYIGAPEAVGGGRQQRSPGTAA
jgi:DNA-binding CsgD family transcriptional regulator